LTRPAPALQLYDTTTLEPIKTYKSDRPINSAAISPLMDHVSNLKCHNRSRLDRCGRKVDDLWPQSRTATWLVLNFAFCPPALK
jgi:hypothetical protein